MRRLGKILLGLMVPAVMATSAAYAGSVRLTGHLPLFEMSQASYLQREQAEKPITLTVVLDLRNKQELQELISRLYTPGDALYGRYLTPAQFNARYAPTAQDIAQVSSYLTSRGLAVLSNTTNTIKVSGSVSTVENAFNVQIGQYQAKDSRTVYSANLDPELDLSVASKIVGVIGLNSFSKFTAYRLKNSAALTGNTSKPPGSGPGGGLAPSDIQKAYLFNSTGNTGSGQTLALMELDGYTPSDITQYEKQFGLSNVPKLQNVLVDSYDGSAGDGADEVTLDIELMMAVAPGASTIMVYEGPNSETGPVDVYAKIANDDVAKQVSTSWGSPESQNTSAYLNSENTIFMQMAAQGQSIYAASGDSGAYDDGSTLSVDDPASQPYVTGTGGTTLSLNSDGSYKSESSWGIAAQGQNQSEGGGGGISSVWPLPSYQNGIANSTNKGSTSNRMVPDVSIDGNPQTGYAIYVGGSWNVYGGTSCAAPIWAAFTSLVNSQRTASGLPTLGFANPTVYSLAQGANYSQLFNDINDQSTNLYYEAVSGYDLSTGWGSIKIPGLLSALAAFATGN